MPLLAIAIVAMAGTVSAQDTSITVAHSDDVIKILWWALGVMATIVAAIITGVSVWMVKKIIEHDKEIVAIKTKCELECDS